MYCIPYNAHLYNVPLYMLYVNMADSLALISIVLFDFFLSQETVVIIIEPLAAVFIIVQSFFSSSFKQWRISVLVCEGMGTWIDQMHVANPPPPPPPSPPLPPRGKTHRIHGHRHLLVVYTLQPDMII